MKINFSIKIHYLNLEKKKEKIMDPLLFPIMNKIISKEMTLSWCVGRKHKSKTLNQNVFEKINIKTKKLVEIIKETCAFCGRNKSQLFIN